MSDKNSYKGAQDLNKQMPSNVTQLRPEKCVADDCKKKPDRANFCEEHYMWFKEGLLTTEGHKAKDFDKKYHSWLRRTQKVA